MAQPLPIAGWYPDPEINGQDRWWDGATWSDTRRASGGCRGTGGKPRRGARHLAAGGARPGPVHPRRDGAAAGARPTRPRRSCATTWPSSGSSSRSADSCSPWCVNSFAGAIISIIGLRRSKSLAGNGVFSNGRGISIAGILIGFIWGVMCLIAVAAFIAFQIWIYDVTSNFQYPDSPVI